jgi:hypothetical protein
MDTENEKQKPQIIQIQAPSVGGVLGWFFRLIMYLVLGTLGLVFLILVMEWFLLPGP